MADARALLRQERQNRRITHPHASYTSDGKLLCNLCETRVKTESAWQAHLHSTQHTLRTNRARDAAGTRGTNDTTKKRKASTLDTSPITGRKKPRADDEDETQPPFSPEIHTALPTRSRSNSITSPHPVLPLQTSTTIITNPDTTAVEEDEEPDLAALDAFTRDLASLEASMYAGPTAAPAVSAAPMTAEQLAVQAREEASSQKGRREVEIEAEREDAARALEVELEEMEGLEERVRRLRERREGLLKGTVNSGEEKGGGGEEESGTEGEGVVHVANGEEAGEGEEDAEDDEEEDEDDHVWGFDI